MAPFPSSFRNPRSRPPACGSCPGSECSAHLPWPLSLPFSRSVLGAIPASIAAVVLCDLAMLAGTGGTGETTRPARDAKESGNHLDALSGSDAPSPRPGWRAPVHSVPHRSLRRFVSWHSPHLLPRSPDSVSCGPGSFRLRIVAVSPACRKRRTDIQIEPAGANRVSVRADDRRPIGHPRRRRRGTTGHDTGSADRLAGSFPRDLAGSPPSLDHADPPARLRPVACAESSVAVPAILPGYVQRSSVCSGDRDAVRLGPRRIGLGQQLLLGRSASRDQELEGILLRLLRRIELHHRRQTTRRPLGHGALGAGVRGQRVEHPGPPGARRSGHSRPSLPSAYAGGSPPPPGCWPVP